MRKVLMVLAVVILIFAAVLIYSVISEKQRPSDEVQIRELLVKGESALEHKTLRSAMSCVSKDYTDDASMTYDELRAELQTYFLQQGTYDIQLSNTSIRPIKSLAKVTADVSVSLVYGNQKDKLYSSPLDIVLIKEKARRWLVMPTKVWKVTSVAGMPQESEMME